MSVHTTDIQSLMASQVVDITPVLYVSCGLKIN